MSAVTRVRLPRLSIGRLRPPRLRTLLAVALAVALGAGGWLWVRGSSLVSVDRVTVLGVRGPNSGQIRSALTSAARNMTTLDVNLSALQAAVAPFPVVRGISVSTQFPHGMRIRVIEQVAVGVLTVGRRRISVAASGKLLPSVNVSGLPSIRGAAAPQGGHVSGAAGRAAVALLAAAPAWLRARVSQVSTTTANGLVADLRNGPELYFGEASSLPAKWTAAADVLADPGSRGAAYIDVTAPRRPAAGGVASSASTAQSASSVTGSVASTGATGTADSVPTPAADGTGG